MSIAAVALLFVILNRNPIDDRTPAFQIKWADQGIHPALSQHCEILDLKGLLGMDVLHLFPEKRDRPERIEFFENGRFLVLRNIINPNGAVRPLFDLERKRQQRLWKIDLSHDLISPFIIEDVPREVLISWKHNERGGRSPLVAGGQVIGSVLRTRDRVRPLFVSPGHKVSLDDAVEIVLACAVRFRIPEPLRRADALSRKAKKGFGIT
jgi:hypothetical protein